MIIGYCIIGSKKFNIHGKRENDCIVIEIRGLKLGNLKTLAEEKFEYFEVDMNSVKKLEKETYGGSDDGR